MAAAASTTTALLAIMVVAILPMASHGGAWAAAPAVPPVASGEEISQGCMAVFLEKLLPCAAYVEGGSNLAEPGRDCCVGLAAVADGAPRCLCALMFAADGSELYGVRIDHGRAAELPGICRVAMPPLDSTCSVEACDPSPAPGGSLSSLKCNKKCSGVDPGLGSPALPLLAGLAVAGAAVTLF